MPFSHIVCNVEYFRSGAWPGLTGDGADVFIDETRIFGWFLAHSDILSMEVTFHEKDQETFRIDRLFDPSDGVWDHYGAMFGDRARNCRFHGSWRMPAKGTSFGPAVLTVRMRDGTHELALDPPIMEAKHGEFSAADAELVMAFESLGDSCEFGLVQRRVGRERLGLLRYAGVMDPFGLATALHRRLDGFAEGDELSIENDRGEWVCRTRLPHLDVHTGRAIESISRGDIERQERTKLRFLAQKLIDDIEVGQHIFIYRTIRGDRGGPDGISGIDEIHDAMRSIGPAPLLWVTEADADHVHGSVVHIRDHLYRGFIRSLAPYDSAHAGDDQGWLDLLGAARAVIGASS